MIRFSSACRRFVALLVCGACTLTLAQQDDSYLRSEFDRVWAEYKQNALAENHEAALRFARRAYELSDGGLTLDAVLVAEVTTEFGNALLVAGKASESMPILELALGRTKSAHGARSPKLISVLTSLADASGTNQS